MAKQNGLAAGIAEPERVDAFMRELDHPLSDVVEYLRKLFLSIDTRIGEGIYWNAPAFYYIGEMGPFDPKEYRRYIVGLNLFKQDAVRIIFLRGASVKAPAGLLEGDYADGRRLMSFTSVADVKSKEKDLKNIVQQLVAAMK